MHSLKSLLVAATALAGLVLPTLALPASAETLTIWSRSGQGDTLEAVAKAYDDTHADKVSIVTLPVDEFVQKYATAIAAGTAPDAVSLDLIHTPAFAQAGQLEDLTDWAKSLPYFEALSPAHLSVGTYHGRIYGLPLTTETSVLAWNKDLFARAGLDPEKGPKTWAEWKADAAKVTALGGDSRGFYFSGACGGCFIFTFTPLIWASGGDILADEGAKATLDTPQLRGAVDFYRSLVAGGMVPASARTDTGPDFLSIVGGRIGLQSIGASQIGVLINKYPNVHFGVTLIPGPDGGTSSFVGGNNIVVTKGAKSVKAVEAFMAYVYSLEGQRLMVSHGSLPARSDIAAEAMKGQDPRYDVAVAAIKVGRTPYSPVFNDIINSPNGPWAQMVNAAIFGSDPAAAIKDGQARMQDIIDAAR
ncbi:ABC transporter substrate-binding protein [Lichenibacterium ramalinae]|uniref:Sugar ABC transporter substrate-binding protein n=1 Tax=Lichenibacterium ramalinae TaxID=2316527 RepID=A0A4Q2REY4_9HYPH|nr:sugar ABC transporter substrate-binding protein [Lichenibacterium ramalinae]RYB04073.1 sugar ABC transporter substrate-binding protein [Lichenibacterium ramalinae]